MPVPFFTPVYITNYYNILRVRYSRVVVLSTLSSRLRLGSIRYGPFAPTTGTIIAYILYAIRTGGRPEVYYAAVVAIVRNSWLRGLSVRTGVIRINRIKLCKHFRPTGLADLL
jgi:hypothetical protein